MIRPISHIAQMVPYTLADLSVSTTSGLISLAQNESAFPPSPLAIAAARDALASSQLYPDPDWQQLRTEIAQAHAVDAEHVLCGAGSMELIGCLIRCYAGIGDHVLSSEYAYAFFRTATLAAGARYDTAPEVGMTISVDSLLSCVHERTAIVCVANPANPTGTYVPLVELTRLREALRDDILLIIDEAYGEFVDGPGMRNFDLVSRGNTVVLRTFSKAYGLAGLRIGWGLFPPEIAKETRKLLNPNNVSVASQAAAVAALRDQSYVRDVCRKTIDCRNKFVEMLEHAGLDVPASHTNFVLICFPDQTSAIQADHALRAEGIIMRGMAGYALPHCLRATIGKAEDMDLVASVLNDCFRRD